MSAESSVIYYLYTINSLRLRKKGKHVADDTFNTFSPMKMSLKFVSKDTIDNRLALIRVTVCRRTGDKPYPELMIT